MADPAEPIYQNVIPGLYGLGGYWKKVRLQDLDQAELIRASEMQRGADMMWLGVWVAVACAVGHGIIKSTYPLLKPVSRVLEWGIVAGIGLIGVGMVYKKITQYENWIALGICVGIGGYLLYRFRDWSISHLFNRKQINRDNG